MANLTTLTAGMILHRAIWLDVVGTVASVALHSRLRFLIAAAKRESLGGWIFFSMRVVLMPPDLRHQPREK